MTAGARRLSIMLLTAMVLAGGLFSIHSLAVGPGVSFSFLQSGFSQELIGTTNDLLTGDVDGDDVPDGILGGVAFDPHGNPMVAECEFQGTRLHVFDLQDSTLAHGNNLSNEVVLPSQGGCGLVNHPDGFVYVAMNDAQNGVAKISRATGQFVAFMGPPGNSLGIAVDPQVNQSGTHDLVYAAADCRFTDGCTYVRLNPADGTHSVFGHLDAEDADFTDGMYFDPTGNFLFIANRSPELRMTVLNRAGQLLQHVAMDSEPDGIAFHATAPKFVVTNNTDGTMTRFNFPDDDYTQPPSIADFASGGYRGDLSQVGDDGCIYLTQKGVHYNDLISTTEFDPDNSVVRICGGFAPAPGVEHEEDNTGSITGTIFQDSNPPNGTQESGELGIPNVTVTLTDDHGNTTTTTTDTTGHFEFTELPPGEFTITVTPPEGLSSENPTTPVTVDSGSTTPVTHNFPLVAGSISGFAYVDLNGDGFKNAGEPGILGVRIDLAGGPGGFAMTGADGGYSFGDLPGASYNVSAPASAAGKTRSTTSPQGVALAAGEHKTDVNFGYVPGGLSGFAYVDLNGNGVKDGGEPGIDGVTITLGGGSSSTTTTSGGGAYSFTGLDAGGFTVSAPATADGKSLATAGSLNVTLAEGQHSPDHNFGYVPGAISGFAYVDTNGNDAKDGGEPGIGGVSITLSGQASDSATTGADGSYSFTSLDGGSYNASAPSVAGGKALATASPLTVALAAGEERDHVDFGYMPGGLSGFAYLDMNHNSLKDGGEPGIGGVTIALAGGGTIVTAADGSYAFSSLNAGDYSVMAPASAGATTLFTMSPLSVTLAAGQTQPNVNFGYVSPNPGASLTKTASPMTYDTPGQVIVYTYIIQNTGDVTLGGPFTITDDKLGSFQCGAATSLAPGTSLSCTRSYTIQASDLGSAPSLPAGVTANINTGAWLQGVMSTQDTTISGAAPGLPDGVYPGWCIQDHVNVDLHDQPGTLYSTIGGNLPADVASLPWGKVNYVLNHKIRGAGKSDLAFFKDVQTAVWVSLGEPNPEFGISADAQQMIDAANAHANYVPGYGEVVAVIIYSDGMGTNPNTIQESIIEVRPYQSITNHATATASAGQVTIQTSQAQATVSQVPAPTPPPVPTAPMDAVAWGHRPSAATTVTTSVFSTTAGSELLLAFVSADGPSPGTNSVTGVSGAGLTWQLVKRSNVQLGTAEIWRAFAPGTLSNVSVTATLSKSAASSLTVVSMTGVDTSGTNGSGAIGATASNNGSTGAPTISLTTTRANSWIFGVGNDWDNPIARTVGANQAMVHQYMPPVGDTFWVQRIISSIPSSGAVATLDDTAPSTDRWNFAAVEILQPGPPPPMVPVPNVVSMTQAAATSTISAATLTTGGVNNASSSTVPSGCVISQNPAAGAQAAQGSAVSLVVSSGPVVTVPDTVNMTQAAASTAITNAGLAVGVVTTASSGTVPSGSVISQNPAAGTPVAPGSAVALVVSSGSSGAAPTVDKVVFSDGNGTRTTSAFSTTSANEVLLAFVASDGPTSGGQTVTVSGAGLTWTLVKRANTQLGAAEIWKATAASQLTDVKVKSVQSKTTYHQSLTVVTFKGAAGVGASASAGALNGAPSVSLTTTKANALVYGVGNGWDTATARTLGANQTMVHQWVDTSVGDTFWVQSRSAAIAAAGTSVQINDTAPTSDRWNFAIVEIVP